MYSHCLHVLLYVYQYALVWNLIRYGSTLVILWSLYCLRFEMFAFPPSDPSLILCGCLHKQVVVFAFVVIVVSGVVVVMIIIVLTTLIE